ncbi:hypothetical protein AXE83_03540 [Streptococcus sp. oral taxon 431]|uniref:ATP-binding protein n=1 Tax=Streptococcus sp. oral taxon 431 TaxID=712633 RepID=UPI0007682C8C|nr:ATP-binding protein [Streptococcus sp. oral taxon 431]AMD96720.1 hypothetical protein AXE83_03540 [Streptococcus sp. oral taxon 431]
MSEDYNNKDNQLRVKSFEPNLVQIEIVDFKKWKEENSEESIKIGSVLKIEDGNNNNILCIVKSFKMIEKFDDDVSKLSDNVYEGNFIINTQPIGRLQDGTFKKGINDISIPPNGVSVASMEELEKIYSMEKMQDSKDNILEFAKHNLYSNIGIKCDGDKLFSKHLAIVGSTGSGKSCAVATVIQTLNVEIEKKNNTHVLIFDIHGEYKKAFPNSNHLALQDNSLKIPYWLMTSDELEDLFIESSDLNAYNQISQFKFAVTQNKIKYNSELDNIDYNSPVYFSINEVRNYLYNKNKETHYVEDGEEYLAVLNVKGKDEKLVSSEINHFWEALNFETSTGNSKHKVFNQKVAKAGGFTGEFERFISRIDTKLKDKRLSFILQESEFEEGSNSFNMYIEEIKRMIGYSKKNNVTVIDLSTVPFEIVSIIVSVVSRILFDFAFLKTKIKNENDTPYMVVFEEAHKYIPRNNSARYSNSRLSVERIAKEGRKYGLSAMIVSQRPSELSSTVFSQCNNFIVMRLSNPEDQGFVKSLLPEASISFGDEIANLEQREALLVGDAFTLPMIARMNDANPTPKSDDVNFYSCWQEDWKDVKFDFINTESRK